jgi:hypothetical protein
MLLFTTFILVFALSSGKVSEEDLANCFDKFVEFKVDIQGNNQTIKDFEYDYDEIEEICHNTNLDQDCIENFYKKNILNLNYDELVKNCNCLNQNCGGPIATAGFGGSVSGTQLMCGYLLCLMAVFGIVGNVMSMKVFWHPEMWKSKFNQILFGK